MPDVANLKVVLTAETASFTGPLNKAGEDAKRAAGNIQDGLGKIDTREARGSLMLLGEEMGVHLPRHVQRLIADLPGVGQALALAFPVFAVVAIGKAILDAIDKSKQHAEALNREATEAVGLTRSLDAHAASLVIDNLRLEDSIRILNKQIPQNAIKIAAAEAQAALQKLEDEFDKVNSQEEKLFKSERANTWSEVFFNSFSKTKEEINSNADTMVRYFADISELENQYQLAKDEHRDTDAAKFKNSLEHQKAELKWYAKASISDFTGNNEDDKRYATKLRGVVISLNREAELEKQTAEHITNIKGEADAKTLQQHIAGLDQQYAAAKQTSDAQTKDTIATFELWHAQGEITAGQLATLKQDALDRQYQMELAHFEKIKALEAGHPELLKHIQAEEDALTANHDAQIRQSYTKTLEAQKRDMDALEKSNEEFYHKQQAEDDKATAQIIKNIENKNKARVADLALIQGEGNRQIAQIDKEIFNLQRLIAQYNLQGPAAAAVNAKIHELSLQRQKDLNDEMLKSGKLGLIFHATMNQMVQDGLQWKIKVAQTFTQSVNQMNQSLSQFVTTGKADWRSLGASAMEQILEIGLKYFEAHAWMLITKGTWNAASQTMDAAHTATTIGKNVLEAQSSTSAAAAETLADVPYPANIPASISVLATGEGYTAGAAAELGGVLPNREMLVHTHPEEMILPKNISNFVLNAASNASSNGGGSNGQAQNVTYSPVINGQMDEAKLHAHFERWARARSRKNGQRFN